MEQVSLETLEQMQKNLQQADLLLAVQSPSPEVLLETVQIYRRVMRTISQFQQKSDEWMPIRKKLAEAEQRLSSAITNKQSELNKTTDPLVREQLNRDLDLLLQKNDYPWKWLQKNAHNGSVSSTDKVDVQNNINI